MMMKIFFESVGFRISREKKERKEKKKIERIKKKE